MREQIAQQPPIRRASLPPPRSTAAVPPASPHRAGHHPGLHPEGQPYTTFTRTRSKAPTPDEEEEDDEPVSSQRTRSSAIVYRQPSTQVEVVPHREGVEEQPRRGTHPMLSIGISLLIVLAFITASLFIPPAYHQWQDNLTYGYPRTSQTDANVGHGGVSHFIVMNWHGTIEVMEVPADPTKNQPHLYLIVHFADQGADLIPATVSFPDINGDGKPEMQVTVYNGTNPTIYVLFNTGTQFQSHP